VKKSDVINILNKKHGFRRYLEISSLTTGRDFAKVDATNLDKKERLAYRWPDGHSDGAPVTFSTPQPYSCRLLEYLLFTGQRYDSIFVDPYHSYACSYADLSGAFALLEPGGVMIVHDSGPHDPALLCPEYREGFWCGLTYAAFIDFTLRRRDLSYYTVDCDYGCGVIYKQRILMPYASTEKRSHLLFDWDIARHDDDTRLQFYLENRASLLNLITEAEFNSQSQFCELCTEVDEPELTAIRAELLSRDVQRGYTMTDDPDLQLIVDGAVVQPESIADGRYRFVIPADSGAVWFASRSVIPAEVEVGSPDRRRLGVPVERIKLSDVDLSIAASHGHAGLRDGFHEDEGGHRWTDGMARLPDELLRSFRGAFTLDVHLVASALRYRLAAPDPAARSRLRADRLV
jgi:hypothetical protein